MKTKTRYAIKLETKQVREEDFPYNGQSLSCTNEVLAFANSLQDSDVEKFLVLHLNAQNILNCIQVVIGTVNQAVVYPREVIKHAILSNSSAMILIHNHPSGKETPSESDIRLTKLIVDACKPLDISVHDHIIIGNLKHSQFYSFRENGMMPL
jgi:DNA repair protein RadC